MPYDFEDQADSLRRKMEEEVFEFERYQKHNTDSEDCWCEPEIIELENGNKVVIHRGDN